MSDITARLGLPYLAAGQMQKHVTLNEALTRLDALVQTVVVSRSVAAQPEQADDGDLYLLPASASGPDWAGRPAGTLMRHEAGGWLPVSAPDGLIVQVRDADEIVVLEGGEVVPLGARLGPLQQLTLLGLGTTADTANPFAAKLNKALWAARETGEGGDGDLRVTFNKQAAGDILSLLLQTAYGGRAELGLIGDDDLRLKVSADGAIWHDAFSVDRATGRVGFAAGAVRRERQIFTSDGSFVPPVWARILRVVAVGGGGGGGAGVSGSASARFGGGGGGAGGVSTAVWAAADLDGALEVVVGAGGSAGSGAAGGAGADSLVRRGGRTLCAAIGGSGGQMGGVGPAAGGAGAGGRQAANAGGASTYEAVAAEGQWRACPDGPGGGGAGGGLETNGVLRPAGDGGRGGQLRVQASGGLIAGGAPGGVGEAAPRPSLHWSGGGGGGGSASSSGPGRDGGAGGLHGAGGGGGGSGLTAAGAGGAGAAGVVWLIAEG